MSEAKHLDNFADTLNPAIYPISKNMKELILNKAKKRINQKRYAVRMMIAACIVLLLISAFIPNTPVYALRQNIFSFIPGIGVIQENENGDRIVNVLQSPVKVTENNAFIEIHAAYATNDNLRIFARTNVGVPEISNIKEMKEQKRLLEFAAGESSGIIYLVSSEEKIQAGSMLTALNHEGVTTVDATFPLQNGMDLDKFCLEFEGFNQKIEIYMFPAASGSILDELGSVVQVDENILIFADVQREGEVIEVLTTIIAPKEYEDLRMFLYDFERSLFHNDVHILDQGGNRYLPDDELRRLNNSGMNSLYFNVPQEKEGLRLVIPQILYTRGRLNNGIEIQMNVPKPEEGITINKEFQLGDMSILIEQVSFVPAGHPLLPDEWRAHDVMKVDTRAEAIKETNEMICRIMPDVQINDRSVKWRWISQAVNGELWALDDQRGYALVQFSELSADPKILMTFDVEFARKGPWVIELE